MTIRFHFTDDILYHSPYHRNLKGGFNILQLLLLSAGKQRPVISLSAVCFCSWGLRLLKLIHTRPCQSHCEASSKLRWCVSALSVFILNF